MPPLRLIAREDRIMRFPVLMFSAFSLAPSLPFFLSLSLSWSRYPTRSRASIFWEIVQLPNIQAASHGHCNRCAVDARTLAPLRDLGAHLAFLL